MIHSLGLARACPAIDREAGKIHELLGTEDWTLWSAIGPFLRARLRGPFLYVITIEREFGHLVKSAGESQESCRSPLEAMRLHMQTGCVARFLRPGG